MDDSAIALIVIALLAFPILAIVSFIMALSLNGRVRRLEERLRQVAVQPARQAAAQARSEVDPARSGEQDLRTRARQAEQAQAAPRPSDPAPESSEATPVATAPEQIAAPIVRRVEQGAVPVTTYEPEQPGSPDKDIPSFTSSPSSTPKPSSMPSPAVPATPVVSLEEKLGARWAVWVGGVALALGGAFLVRYAIEEELLGPAARIIAGLIFSIGLIGFGEYLRRRPLPTGGAQAAYIPGVVTAAGTVALFATIYAAYALYGFLGPAEAFIVLGLVGVATMYAAALHGPWLAGLGLAGAYGTPLLVSTNDPTPWALAIYVIVVTAAAFMLARIRLWRWLVITATVAALVYGFALVTFPGDATSATTFLILGLTALVAALLVYDTHRGEAYRRFDPVGLSALAGLAILSVSFANADVFSHLSLAVMLIVAIVALASALRFDAMAPGAVIAGLSVLACLWLWPIAGQLAQDPVEIIPGHLFLPFLMPDALEAYLEIAIIPAAALFLATTASLMRRSRERQPAFALALAGTATPIFALAIAYLRVGSFHASLPFGAVAAGLAVLFAATTERFLRVETSPVESIGIGSSLHAVASCSALALTLTFVIADSPLTLAFGLSALGAAWVSTMRPLPALRWCAAGFVLLVLARLGGVWMVAGTFFERFPDWQDIGLRYAVPALAVFYGGVLLRRRKSDLPAAILDVGALVLGAAAAAFAVRLGVRGPVDALHEGMTLAEAGLYTSIAFAAVLLLVYRSPTSNSEVYRVAGPVCTVVAICLTVMGPLIVANPLVSGDGIGGGPVFNTLLPGYALPGLLAAAAAQFWMWFGTRPVKPGAPYTPQPFTRICGIAAFVLGFVYVTMEARKISGGGEGGVFAVSSAESYGYTVAWILYGVALLAIGIATSSRDIRLGSAVAIILAVAKAFLIDMSELAGIWRALSFIGLGAALIGIGLVYQRLLFGRREKV